MIFQFLISKFIDFIQLRKYSQYKKYFKDPSLAQKRSLDLILERTHQCAIRKTLGIEEVRHLEEFRKRCPITTYKDYDELAQSLFDLENRDDLLNTQKASYFIATSGTTSRPKLFPVTEYYREEFQRVFLAWLGCIKKIRPQAFLGKSLYLADASIVGVSPTGVSYGVLSGYNFRKIPKTLREILYCTHENFYELGDNKKRDITLLAHALSSNVTNIGTVMPETILQFVEKFFDYGQDVLKFMKTGVPPFDYPPAFEKSLRLIPDAGAILRMEALLEKGESQSLHDFFPNLNTIICWKGATAKFYYEKLRPYLHKDVVVWDAIYSASEGVFNLPDDPDQLGGPIAVDGNFLEFRDVESRDGDLLLVHELKLNREYEVFCTTSMGLFRYQMNDKVLVTGFRDKTPIIVFVEKMGLWLNHAMERITTTHVCELVDQLKAKLNLDPAKLSYFTMCPCKKQDLVHYLLILETDYDEDFFKDISLDEIFFAINPNYKRNIEGKLLGPMILKTVRRGYLKDELTSREDSKQTTAQFKYSPIETSDKLSLSLCPCCN